MKTEARDCLNFIHSQIMIILNQFEKAEKYYKTHFISIKPIEIEFK